METKQEQVTESQILSFQQECPWLKVDTEMDEDIFRFE